MYISVIEIMILSLVCNLASATFLPSSQPSRQPTCHPSTHPTMQPSRQPTIQPSEQPTAQPSSQPVSKPSSQPTTQPSLQPIVKPSRQPSSQPSSEPTRRPSVRPTYQPTSQPSNQPTLQPTCQPTRQPSTQPTRQPSTQPTRQPTSKPTRLPTSRPSSQPTLQPTSHPTNDPSSRPSSKPSSKPSNKPTSSCPTSEPTTNTGHYYISTIAGTSNLVEFEDDDFSYDDEERVFNFDNANNGGLAVDAQLFDPVSVWGDGLNIYVTEHIYVRKIDNNGIIVVFAGTEHMGYAGDGGPATSARLLRPVALASDTNFNVYIADYANNTIRRVSDGIITTFAGMGDSLDDGNGCAATSANFYGPRGVWVDGNNYVYVVSSESGLVRKIDPQGIVAQFVGNAGSAGVTVQHFNIRATSAELVYPYTVIGDGDGVFYLTDAGGRFVYKIEDELIGRYMGSDPEEGNDDHADGVAATSTYLSRPIGVAVDSSSGQVYVSDKSFYKVFVVNDGISSTVVGKGGLSNEDDDGIAVSINLVPMGLYLDESLDLYIADPWSAVVRKAYFRRPTMRPTSRPSSYPSNRPSAQPSRQPFDRPSTQPSNQPSCQPSSQPLAHPSSQPTLKPSTHPTSKPSVYPTSHPTRQPSTRPSAIPSIQPSAQPSLQPSVLPSAQPIAQPTAQPSSQPTSQPTTLPTMQPSTRPSSHPSGQPSSIPTHQPFRDPTSQPSIHPTLYPTDQPSSIPSENPTSVPTEQPSDCPSAFPSQRPQSSPTCHPTSFPTAQPFGCPSSEPSTNPSVQPISLPTWNPSSHPSGSPTCRPTSQPSEKPSIQPSNAPSGDPSGQPSRIPSGLPSNQPVSSPSGFPSTQPFSSPTSQPSKIPSERPSGQPSSVPSCRPSHRPSTQPSGEPSGLPSDQPSDQPSMQPSVNPSSAPSSQPTFQPAVDPTIAPSAQPTSRPSSLPTRCPTGVPTGEPSGVPTSLPSQSPSSRPSSHPSSRPTIQPQSLPSSHPTDQPSVSPTAQPSQRPHISTSKPTHAPLDHPIHNPTSTPTVLPAHQWTAALQSALNVIAANKTRSIAHQSLYYELDVAGSLLSRVFGSCSSWISMLSSDLKVSLYSFVPRSVQFTIVPYLGMSDADIISSTITCSDSILASRILDQLTNSTVSLQMTNCSNRLWVSKTCPGTSVPSVCIGCDDPCSTTLHCSSSTSLFGINPCVASTCMPTSAARILSVSFGNMQQPPTVLSRAVSTTKNAVNAQFILSSKGSVHCAAYSGTAIPQSISAVTLYNRAGVTDSLNSTTVSLMGLSAATSYNVYCYTMSSGGTASSYADMVDSVFVAATSCCKELTVQLSVQSVIEQTGSLNVLILTLSAPPSQDIQLTVGCNITIPCFVPSVISISTKSTSLVYKSSLVGLPSGVYFPAVQVTSNTHECDVVYSQSLLRVLSSTQTPPVPNLLSAIFASDGSYLTVSFDSNTNRGGVATIFNCNTLFTFACASTSQCVWIDDKTVKAIVYAGASGDINQCVGVSDAVGIASGSAIKAKCPTISCPSQATWMNVSHSAVSPVKPSLAPLTPTVSISAPSVIGECNTLTLDLSSSTGLGGRAWANVTFVVDGLEGSNSAAIQHFLNTRYVPSPPTPVPYAMMKGGFSYGITVIICNFLLSCGQGSVKTVVVNNRIPAVNILGLPLRNVGRTALNLKSNAYVADCGGSSVSAGLTYQWSVESNGVPMLDLISSSKDPSAFALPAFTLNVNTMYKISLTAASSQSTQSSTASVQVFVVAGDVVSVLLGGASTSVIVGESITIDASRSYDQDVPGVFGVAAGLHYTWSCIQTAPEFKDNCSAVFANSFNVTFDSIELATNPSSLLALGSALVTVTITDANQTRSASSGVTVTVLPPLSPVVSVSSNQVTGVVNTDSTLQLMATVDVPTSLNATCIWSVDDESIFTLEDTALLPISKNVSSSSSSKYVYMSFSSGALPAGLTLSFALTCRIPSVGTQSTASLGIVVNAPPQPGQFSVNPIRGTELHSNFTFMASLWSDSDLPLSYQFGYVSVSGTSVVLMSKSESSFGNTLLVAGLAVKGFVVSCELKVFDKLSASADSYFDVQVLKNPVADISVAQQLVANLSFDSVGSVNGMRQALALSSHVLNSVNCSQAPNCSALNRMECYRTAHTCGECMSSSFVGVYGDDNSQCIHSWSGAPSPPICNVDSECRGLLEVCANHTCIVPQKKCVANCSSNGVCTLVNVASDNTVDSCPVSTSGCVAKCNCYTGYSGSQCELTESQFSVKQATRALLVAGMVSVMSLEDASAPVISGWISSLQSASQASNELTSDSAGSVLSIASGIAQYSASGLVGSEGLVSLLGPVSNAVGSIEVMKDHRRRLDEVVDVSDTLLVLQSIGTAISNTMVPGQIAVESIQDQFRMHTSVLSSDDSTNSGTTINLPATSIETSLSAPSTSVMLPSMNTLNVQVTIVSLTSALYGNRNDSLKSDTLSVFLSELPCFTCTTQVTIQNTESSGLSTQTIHKEVFNVTCADGDFTEQTYNCTTFDFELLVSCNGTAGVMHAYCPSSVDIATCNSLSSDGSSIITDNGCNVTQSSDASVSCICPLDSSAIEATANGYSVSYVSMLKATSKSFVSTFESAGNLNNHTVAKGWKVLVTIGVFVACVLMSVGWSYRKDMMESKVTPTNEDKKQSAMSVAAIVGLKSGKEKSKISPIPSNESHLKMIESSLPAIMSSESMIERWKREVKKYHRWFGVIFFYSDSFPRALRVISLTTNIIIMLFIQSITYNLTNPDDGSCATYHSKSACLQPSSAFATGESKCFWTGSSATDGQCAFNEPDASVKVILFVAIFSAIISTPIALLIDWLIHNKIAAPVAKSRGISEGGRVNSFASVGLSESRKSSLGLSAHHRASHLQACMMELNQLSQGIRRYRESLSDVQRAEFDVLWGLDENGCFIAKNETAVHESLLKRLFFSSAANVDVNQAVLSDLQEVHKITLLELEKLENDDDDKTNRNRKIAKRLLYLFQLDLLPGVSGLILESKSNRDAVSVGGVSKLTKILSWLVVVFMDVGMLFYILLFALQQNNHRQSAWFKSFILWLVVEIFVVSTATVLVTHIIVPSIVMKDVHKIKQKLMEALHDFRQQQQTKQKADDQINDKPFNATEYLFVSHRVAQQFPEMEEAKLILHFSTPWPKKTYQHAQNVSKDYSKKWSAVYRSVSIILVFFLTSALNIPPTIQDMVIHMCTSATIGYTILLHIDLFHIFPLLAFIPFLCLMGLTYAFIQHGKVQARRRMAALTPLFSVSQASDNRNAERQKTERSDNHAAAVSLSSPNGLHKTRKQSVLEGAQVIARIQDLSKNDGRQMQNSIDEYADVDEEELRDHFPYPAGIVADSYSIEMDFHRNFDPSYASRTDHHYYEEAHEEELPYYDQYQSDPYGHHDYGHPFDLQEECHDDDFSEYHGYKQTWGEGTEEEEPYHYGQQYEEYIEADHDDGWYHRDGDDGMDFVDGYTINHWGGDNEHEEEEDQMETCSEYEQHSNSGGNGYYNRLDVHYGGTETYR